MNIKFASLISMFAASSFAVSMHVSADQKIELGMSLALSGAAANWGIGAKWMCEQAAKEVEAGGGVKVNGKIYNFNCLAYDNKYNAADGAKVAQTLLSKDNVKFVIEAHGTAAARATQSLSERRGVIMFTTAWGDSLLSPKLPLSFRLGNGPHQIIPPLVNYVKTTHPEIKTVALLNPNDASGKEIGEVARAAWEAAGVKVVTMDWFERGTTEFQPIATKLAALKPDVIDVCASPPSDSGRIFTELTGLGWKGIKISEAGTSATGILVTGRGAVEDVYMGLAVPQGKTINAHQADLNKGIKALTGEDIAPPQIGSYDGVKALAAAMEKAQSIDPKVVAETLPTTVFQSFYGPATFGAADIAGTPHQILIPAIVTQLKGDTLVELVRVQPPELTTLLAN